MSLNISASNTLPYRPLNESLDEIRLLTVYQADDESEPANCKLEYVSLNDSYPYRALSYCWGDPMVTRTIYVNDHEVQATENLEEALRELRRHGDVRLWVDALCINQRDIDERSRQVLRMVKIYANASETVAWLGKAADNSDLALDLMHILSNYDADKDTWESAMKRQNQPEEVSAYRDHWTALEAFLSRPYWNRIWIIQEVVFARQLLICCGSAHATGIHLGTTLQVITSQSGELRWPMIDRSQASLDGTLSFVSFVRLRQFILELGGGWYPWKDLLFALKRCNRALATLPHDNIYASLALAKTGAELLPAPDYSLPLEEICISTTTAIVSASKDLSIICLGKNSLETNLPSWVPDWCDRLPPTMVFRDEGNGLLDTIYMAASSSGGSFSFPDKHTGGVSEHGHILIAKGFILDMVSGLGAVDLDQKSRNNISLETDYDCIPPDQKRSLYLLQEGVGLEVGILEAFCTSLVIGKREYLSGGLNLLNALFNTSGIHETTRLRDQIKYLLEQWFSKDRLIKVHGRVMEEWYNPAPDATRPIRNVCAQGSGEQYFHDETQAALKHKRLLITHEGRIGMAPHEARKGDKVCILLGCRVPVLLRERQEGGYELVGEAYVQGIMHGESVTDENIDRLEDFEIY